MRKPERGYSENCFTEEDNGHPKKGKEMPNPELVATAEALEILGVKSRWPLNRFVHEGALVRYRKNGDFRNYYDAEALRGLARPVRVEVVK